MAFLVKTSRQPSSGPSTPGYASLYQLIHVTRAAKDVPDTANTEQIFKVNNGRVLVHALIMEATVLFDGTDPVMKVSAEKTNAAMDTLVGTVTDIASTVNLANLEIGGTAFVEGDGTALVKGAAGALLMGTNTGKWVAPRGFIYFTTGGTNATAEAKWDIWYQPLDEGAYVTSVDVATAKI